MEQKRYSAFEYSRNSCFLNTILRLLKRGRLSYQEYKTLRGQALSGDGEGARRGLERLMKERL